MECNGPAERGGMEGAAAIARLRGSGLFDASFYTNASPELAALGDRALPHYYLQGWREGRRPNFYFDPGWYLAQYQDVREAGIEPLLHYLIAGEAEGRRPCPLFDPAWYGRAHGLEDGENRLAHLLTHRRDGGACAIAEFDAPFYLGAYPDIREAGIDPFEHYLVQGFREARRPFEGFDPQFYRGRYLRGLPDANPLLHYLAHRGEPGFHPSLPAGETTVAREVRRRTGPSEAFEARAPLPAGAPRRARVLAYYLPQYHPIEENNRWWGDGFTEWTNIARVLPRFAGHYQPRVPRDLGHYRLDGQAGAATMARQIEFARGAGIDGFVFYFYWFNGRRLLDGPLEALLADSSLDMPFCLMWANENWTRRWDGSDDEILIGQDYEAGDEADLLACFARHFADPRYIRIDGRPLLMVYRPALIPQAASAVARWRRAMAPEDPILVMSQSFGDLDPRPFGFDGAIEFPPHKTCQDLPVLNPTLDILDHEFHAHVFDYAEVVRVSLEEPAPEFPLIKTAVPSWDNDARRQGAGLVLHGSTPALYQDWLERLVLRASDQPFFGEPLVCINAWNEWAEGAYLEPDLHYGAAYLNATGRAVSGAQAAEPILLVGHDGLRHGAQVLLLHLARHLVRRHGAAVRILLLAPGPLEASFAALGPTTVRAPDDPSFDALIRQLCREGMRAAIVNSLASGAAVMALRARSVRCVLLAHEMPVLLGEKGLTGIASAALAAADEVVVAAREVADALARTTGLEPSRATVRPQGCYSPVRFCPAQRCAARARLGVGAADVLVLGIGYADLRKGFDLFLQLRRLALRVRWSGKVHFLWAGGIDPTLRAYLEAEIHEAVGTGRFHLPGFVEDADDLFSAADVLALTSREDPYPSVVLEAIGAGLETVAFEGAGGIPALLRRERAGVAVRAGDLPRFAEALLRCAAAAMRPGEREARVARAPGFPFDAYAHEVHHLARPALLDVSVVVLSFNYAAYIPQRMASVLGQTHPVREVIVLDDASTDDSVARARDSAGEREVGIVVSAINSGSPFCQWRAAAERASGEWLWLAEADDSAEPGFLQILAERIAAAPDAVLAFADSRLIDSDGKAIGASYQAYYGQTKTLDLSRSDVFDGPSFLRTALAERNLILNASAVLFRRDRLLAALARCQDELTTLRVAGDWRLYAEILSAPGCKVVFEARPLNIHRRHEASVTHRLAARRHLVEIGQVHAAVARIGGLGEAEKARQRAYRQSLRAQFGLRAAER